MKMFATKATRGRHTYFNNVYPTAAPVQMCAGKNTPIYKVDVVVATDNDKNAPYWGWQDVSGRISMIHRERGLIEIGFPYGIEAEEAKGTGKLVRLHIYDVSE